MCMLFCLSEWVEFYVVGYTSGLIWFGFRLEHGLYEWLSFEVESLNKTYIVVIFMTAMY